MSVLPNVGTGLLPSESAQYSDTRTPYYIDYEYKVGEGNPADAAWPPWKAFQRLLAEVLAGGLGSVVFVEPAPKPRERDQRSTEESRRRLAEAQARRERKRRKRLQNS